MASLQRCAGCADIFACRVRVARCRDGTRDDLGKPARRETVERGLRRAVRARSRAGAVAPAWRHPRTACVRRRGRSAPPARAHVSRGMPCATAASSSASTSRKKYAGPEPDSAVTVSISASSSIHAVVPAALQDAFGKRALRRVDARIGVQAARAGADQRRRVRHAAHDRDVAAEPVVRSDRCECRRRSRCTSGLLRLRDVAQRCRTPPS